MDRAFESAVSATPPTAPASPAIGYPRKGDPGTGTAPTKPGPWWYHMVTEEIRAVIVAGGLTPDQNNVTQMRDALIALYGTGRPGHVFTANDWCPLPGGLIVQWGTVLTSNSGDAPVTFPISFPAACAAIASSWNGTPSAGNAWYTNTPDKTPTGFNANTYSSGGTRVVGLVGWIAIGF